MKQKVRFSVLCMVVGVMLAATAFPAYAEPGQGNTPSAARPLDGGLSVGEMEPGAQQWYLVSSASFGSESDQLVVLNMVYRPGGHDVSPYVNFQVFAQGQVDQWLQGYSDPAMGVGTFTTTDFDENSSERLWSGSMLRGEMYYVRLFNNSSAPVEYHLMATGQPVEIVVSEPEVAVAGDERPRAEPAAAVEPASVPAPAPVNAPQPLLSPAASPDEARWQLVVVAVQNMPLPQAAAWLALASQVGLLPGSLPLNPATALPAANAVPYGPLPPFPTQPWVAPAGDSLLAPPPAPSPAPVVKPLSLLDLYPNVYPNRPISLHDGANVGRLAPGGEHWYGFMRQDEDGQLIEHMAITMFATPTDGNTSHYINFQIFPAGQVRLWMRGTPDGMVSMGEGQWVSRDKDPVTGERLWAGSVVDGDTYYVRVLNGSDQVVDYYLITNDVWNTELGDRVFAANQFYPYVLRPAAMP